jgi:hypothetical protein
MAPPDETPDTREKELENRIQMLEKHLERLSAHISEDTAAPTASAPPKKPASQPYKNFDAEEMPELSEEVLGWASQNAVLPRLATVCFLMVIALILRTITDSGLVNKLVGSGLGMGYAAALMGFAWFKYLKESPLAPVFATCGVVLMSTIVVETHTHFQSLPLIPAYLTLMATGFAMALMSRRFSAFTPISVGVLGMCLAGAAIDYPHPFFPYLALVLYTANVLGYFAAQLKRCSWLRWLVLFVTLIMLQLWGLRLGMLLRKGEAIPPELALTWYLPVLAIFFATFTALSLLGVLRDSDAKISRFDFSLPTLNVLWAFTAAQHMVTSWNGQVHLLGAIGIMCAFALFGVAFWSAKRNFEGAPGTNTFVFAGGALLALALPVATGSFNLSLPAISLVAITMAIVSRVWENGGVRGSTYLMNIYACVALAFALRGDGAGALDPINMLPAGLLAVISIYHYQWCRQWPRPDRSELFNSFDSSDRSAALLLLGGLACGFYMIRVGMFQTMQFIPLEMQRDSFRAGQSVLINVAAILLIALAYLRQNKELRNIAVLVTVVGAIKVFLYDLLGVHGLPLVFSIFSFGMAAAIESLALGKWQKQPESRLKDTPAENM